MLRGMKRIATVAKAAGAVGRTKPAARAPAVRNVLVALWMGCDFGRDALGGIRAALEGRGLSWRIRFTNNNNMSNYYVNRYRDGTIGGYERIPLYHGDRANCLMADGHAVSMNLGEWGSLGWIPDIFVR